LSKTEVISQLVKAVSDYYKLDNAEVLSEVMQREEENPTGIANYFALPHGRVSHKKPVVAAAINKEGLDFNSLDGTPSRIIILLLTPRDKNELQLNLLAQIGSSFRNRAKAEDYISASTPEEFIRMIKEN
jgi:fructose PTS system EIIBC or EIIC component